MRRRARTGLLPIAFVALVVVLAVRMARRGRADAPAAGRRVLRSPVPVPPQGQEGPAAAEPVLPIPLATTPARPRRRRGSRASAALLATATLVASVASLQVTGTFALFNDSVSAASVHVEAGAVEVPTALTLTDTGTDVRVAWTAPATGIDPPQYEVFRRASSGSYAGSPIGTSVTTSWHDTAAAECETWSYEVRSRHTNLRSAFTPEASIVVDRTPPSTSAAHLVWTEVTPHVADFVRVSPGGAVEVYADVTDNCSDAADLDVEYRFGAPFDATVQPTYDATGWTPIAGGPTYHFRFQYDLPASAVADGQVVQWDVVATDEAGNAGTTAGTPFTGDGAGPVFTGAEMVSAYTNFYDVALGRGEIPSDGTARASGSYVYADFTDASGVASVTADLAVSGSVVKTGTTALPLVEGAYATYGAGTSWAWRSAATVVNTGLADGNRNFRVTATDRVGNAATTSPAQVVEIDDTAPATGTASCTNAGNANNQLGAGDRSDFDIGDTLFPGSVRAGWDGSALTATAVLRQGTRDYFDVNTDFGVTFFANTTYNQAWNLNATNWVTANTPFPGSTFALASRSALRLTYAGASVTDRSSTAQARFGTTIRDAAGNKVASAFAKTCTTSPW